MQRYENVKIMYSKLEPLGRRMLLNNIISLLYRIYKEKVSKTYQEQINKVIGIVKNQDIYSCGLLTDEITFLKILITNNRGWLIAMQIFEHKYVI
ncbi:MAG: hypothetical protein FWF15_10900 [Oscillospiraceae bacterium]|nr:hypothetical protein [Oscillospiraceae bacterium]